MTAPYDSLASARAPRWAGGPAAVATIHVVDQGGVPGAKDPFCLGNWGEPLGVLSLVVEGPLLALSVAMLTRRRHDP
ncbi:hypothetical protein [Streptantibioticus ferralitis]|uniref:Uncharacterized protein n=1 Tax=Streptantibioticus ferralitis TaxID=236510 RepID=A0ABT5YX44_9ACTN|nr:hypothetical protein [Streptantibioticus ferralitis]MDF2255886.1 hypothetical protein [Streptantibioticus ferralitis]